MASIRNKNDKWQARIKRAAIVVEKSFLNKRDAERWAQQTGLNRPFSTHSPFAPGPIRLAQHPLQDLAGTGHRQRLQEFNTAGALVVGN